MNLSIAPPADPAELEQLAPILAQALQFPVERASVYFESAGVENARLAWLGHELAGGAVLLPMGQYWGGRSVPMTGIAAVGVSPHLRSLGVGVRMMRSLVEELHAAGCPLSVLYPATQPIYRRVGYEVAGVACEVRVPTAALHPLADTFADSEPAARSSAATLAGPGGDSDPECAVPLPADSGGHAACRPTGEAVPDEQLEIRPMAPADEPLVRDLYRAWAADHPGNLDRNAFIWRRVQEFRGTRRLGYVLGRSGSLAGYFYYAQTSSGTWPYRLEIGDRVLSSPAAARRFLRFLADHRSMADEVSWVGPPNDELLLLLREQSRRISANTYWMLRIVHLPAALERRGWPAGVSGELHLEVRDELLPGNNGRWLLRIAAGRGEVTPGGLGRLQLNVRDLSTLYSGYLSAQQLAALGRLRGPAEDQALATALFAGPLPWMLDPF